MGKRPLIISLVSIFSVAFAIRLYFAVHCTAIPGYSDMAWYNEVARQHGLPRELPPGYPLFLRAIYHVFGAANYKAVFMVQGFISALSAALIGWITSKVGNLKAGITAGAVAAIYPNLIVYNLTTLTETIGVFFIALLLAMLVTAIGEKKRSIFAAATILLACAFRPVILFFAPGVFLGLKKKLVFVAALALVIAPYATYELAKGKTVHRAAVALYETYYPTLNGSGFINPKDTELGSDTLASRVYIKAAWDNIRKDKWRVVGNIYNKGTVVFSRGWDTFVMEPLLSRTGSSSALLRGASRAQSDSTSETPPLSDNVAHVMDYAYIPFMLLGFVGMARLYGRRTRMLVLPVLSYLILVILFSIFKFRYRLLVEPVFIMFASLLVWRAGRGPDEPVADSAPGAGPGRSPRARDTAIVSIIFLVALGLRLRLSLEYRPLSDSLDALQMKDLACHGGFGSDTAPLYPLFLRAVYAIFLANGDRALPVVQSVIGSLIVLPMYAAASRLGGRWAGFTAAGMSAVYPGFIGYGLGVRTEWLVVMLVALLMAAGAGRLADGARSGISAALTGLGILVEPALLWLAPGVFLATKRRALFVLVLIAVLAPYTIGIAVKTHRVEPVYQPGMFRVSLWNIDPRSGWNTAGAIYDSANDVVTRGPIEGDGGWSGPIMSEKSAFGRYCYVIIMLLGFIGLARYYRREHGTSALPILIYIAILVVFSSFEIRLRAALEPLLIAYAGMLLAGGRNGL